MSSLKIYAQSPHSGWHNSLNYAYVNKAFQKAGAKQKLYLISITIKNPDDVASNKPPSVFGVGYKTYGTIFFNRTNKHVERCLPEEPFGFRPQRSRELRILNLTKDIEDEFESKELSEVFYVDLSSTYDTVWNWGLIYELTKITL